MVPIIFCVKAPVLVEAAFAARKILVLFLAVEACSFTWVTAQPVTVSPAGCAVFVFVLVDAAVGAYVPWRVLVCVFSLLIVLVPGSAQLHGGDVYMRCRDCTLRVRGDGATEDSERRQRFSQRLSLVRVARVVGTDVGFLQVVHDKTDIRVQGRQIEWGIVTDARGRGRGRGRRVYTKEDLKTTAHHAAGVLRIMPLLPEDGGSHAGGSKAQDIEPDHGDVGVDEAIVRQTKSHRHKPVPLLVAPVTSVAVLVKLEHADAPCTLSSACVGVVHQQLQIKHAGPRDAGVLGRAENFEARLSGAGSGGTECLGRHCTREGWIAIEGC